MADIDGDGDRDLLIASFVEVEGLILPSWYENTDGRGTFGPQHVITAAGGAFAVYAADVDGDGDADLILVSAYGRKIAWSENIDGQGKFGAEQAITPTKGGFSTYAVDINGDGDLDVLTASVSQGTVTWYEQRPIGDSNGDGVFDASDLVEILQAGKYEDDIRRNATFAEGDWNGDEEFDSSDLVLGFQTGRYSFG